MAHLSDKKVKLIEQMANKVRCSIIEMLVSAGSGHTAGPLGMADIFTTLYFHTLHHRPKKPSWEERDRLFLSNGHICPVLYATLAHAGYFPLKELATLRKFGTRLQGHPHRTSLPGLESTSGPLGSGLSESAGYAYAARMDKRKFRVYCLTSDGEHDEGNTWEAVLFAAKYRLANLTVVIDRNYIQIDGNTETVMPLDSLRDKYAAFNWHVIEINGNDIREFDAATREAKMVIDRPTVIIAHTIPGKGIKEIENDYRWHGKPPTSVEAKQFLHELRTLGGKIKSEHE